MGLQIGTLVHTVAAAFGLSAILIAPASSAAEPIIHTPEEVLSKWTHRVGDARLLLRTGGAL
ncbi:MAG: hypothetical protein HC872_05885, partial [Gammaproteobacteria bacterium]|nr:hypothetical protein [Gammaproteobacteria bacterium]